MTILVMRSAESATPKAKNKNACLAVARGRSFVEKDKKEKHEQMRNPHAHAPSRHMRNWPYLTYMHTKRTTLAALAFLLLLFLISACRAVPCGCPMH